MIKGVSKRVVVVKSADRGLFDEAIFVVSDADSGPLTSPEELLREAQRIAASCTKGGFRRRLSRLPKTVCALFGAAATGVVWLLTALL